MAQIPTHVEADSAAKATWKEIERIALSQAVDPSKNEVFLQEVSPRFLEAIQSLERIGGVKIVRIDEELGAHVVRLVYEGEEGVGVTPAPGVVPSAKPSTQKAFLSSYI
jgi:hypothetical protein